jgi:thiol-disulfide isomerase/thioredoxin
MFNLESYKIFFNRIKNDRKLQLLIAILIIIFISVYFFVYNNYIAKFITKNSLLNKEFVETKKDTSNDVVILFFYTEWCPYCKIALPELKLFEDHVANLNSKNDFVITITKIDCDKNPTIADKYKVEGYPTIKLIYKNTVYNYIAKTNKDNLIQFLEASIA